MISPSTRLSEQAFARNRVLGNIGAPLDFDQWESINDDAGEHEESCERNESHDVEGGSISADNAVVVETPQETGMPEVRLSLFVRCLMVELVLRHFMRRCTTRTTWIIFVLYLCRRVTVYALA